MNSLPVCFSLAIYFNYLLISNPLEQYLNSEYIRTLEDAIFNLNQTNLTVVNVTSLNQLTKD